MASNGLPRGLLLALALLVPAVAHAEPTAADKETARTLMQTARDQRTKGDLKGALDSFQKADAIMHVPTTGYEVAATEASLELLVEARDKALEVLRIPEPPLEPRPFHDARRKAQALADLLKPRIPALQVDLQGVPRGETADVTVDGVPVPAAEIGVARKVDPGHHVIVATTDIARGSGEVDLQQGETKELTVALVPIPGAKPKTKPEAPVTTVSPAPTPTASTEPTRLSPLVYVGFAVAGAGLVAGSVTGILSLSATSSAKNGCAGNACPPATYGDIDRANTLATLSDIAFAVGLVGAGIGVYGLVAAPKADPTSGLRVTPVVGPGAAGIAGRF